MERKIGQIFSHGYEIYEVVKNDELHLLGCSGSCFITEDGCCKPDIAGTCTANDRSDNTDVMFISIGNVNTKKNKKTMTREEAKQLLPVIQAFAEVQRPKAPGISAA